MTAKLKEIMISADDYETRAAILENGKLVEIYIEREDSPSIVGDIYWGRVKDVLPGMEAAFVDIGKSKNAFLYVDEVMFFEADIDSSARKIQHALRAGQKILIQVIRAPMGSKGARVSTQISLPGRYLVLMPFTDFIGVSRRLEDKERERIRQLIEEFKPEGMGLIGRTALQEAKLEDIQNDCRFLLELWESIQMKMKDAVPPSVIYRELTLALRMVRDIFSSEFKYLIVDSKEKYGKICAFLDRVNPHLSKRVKLYEDPLPLFDKYNINAEIKNALKRRVWLRSGGHIAIDQAEALTSIDVNTGKYVGKKSLEETILKTNLEAVGEIARQIRLRDIGGIIVIDFIGMESPQNQEKVLKALESALAEDRTKTSVPEITKLGLVEFTRKNVTEGLLDFLGEPCPCCNGLGTVISKETIAIDLARKIRWLCEKSSSEAILVKINDVVAPLVRGDGERKLQELETKTGKSIILQSDANCPLDTCEVVREGRRGEIAGMG